MNTELHTTPVGDGADEQMNSERHWRKHYLVDAWTRRQSSEERTCYVWEMENYSDG